VASRRNNSHGSAEEIIMSSTSIEIHDLPSRFEEMISLAQAGAEVVVTENKVPKAKLIALPTLNGRVAGLHKGAISTTADFDAPLPDEFWTGPT